jgi:hypothetical protein
MPIILIDSQPKLLGLASPHTKTRAFSYKKKWPQTTKNFQACYKIMQARAIFGFLIGEYTTKQSHKIKLVLSHSSHLWRSR